MPRIIFDAPDGATGRETACRRNVEAFDDIFLQSRVLVNVETRSLQTEFRGPQCQVRLGVAPMGMCNLFWPGANTALARALTAHHY